ncbi:DUF5839 family protein [Bacillus safensis]|uniref:DUF5839 family protein n=1 Tax=Bacillus safensis TaxID=561879 RepID=UPI0012DB6AF6|nr:DUF5839 family protein [Bacillus safensis]
MLKEPCEIMILTLNNIENKWKKYSDLWNEINECVIDGGYDLSCKVCKSTDEDTGRIFKIFTAFHCRKRNGELKVHPKPYKWHIPKRLRGQIQQGDIVLVHARGQRVSVLVIDVSREELEETGCYYKQVIKILDQVDKNKENVPV